MSSASNVSIANKLAHTQRVLKKLSNLEQKVLKMEQIHNNMKKLSKPDTNGERSKRQTKKIYKLMTHLRNKYPDSANTVNRNKRIPSWNNVSTKMKSLSIHAGGKRRTRKSRK